MVLIEFEVKAPIPAASVAHIRAALAWGAPESHDDAYFSHPCRDVRQTDEAFRLSVRGTHFELTYKGPRLDARTKARREVVVPIEDAGAAHAWLTAAGFVEAARVRKTRQHAHTGGWEVALDEVPGLGLFIEVERRLPLDADREAAERDAMALLASWGLVRTERASYLELLQARQGSEQSRL